MKILVTGGCGYIGSHTIVDLIENGFDVVSIDNLCNSDESVLEGIERITGVKVKNYAIDLSANVDLVDILKAEGHIDGIIHFAALKAVGESTKLPLEYYQNNLNSLIRVLDYMDKSDIKHFIFSSSCTVYGNTAEHPVTESTNLQKAESPYGNTKQIGEDIISDWVKTNTKSAICLRYFNPAGAHSSCLIGESPINPPQNLVPIITETAVGVRDHFTVFGNDYDTRDGSCIRDFIHVMDLADAHTKAMQQLLEQLNDEQLDFYNLGSGNGVSVLEAITGFEQVNNIKLNYSLGARREGDVIAIYADYSKAKKHLKWEPRRNIEDIMRDAWAWEQKRRNKES